MDGLICIGLSKPAASRHLCPFTTISQVAFPARKLEISTRGLFTHLRLQETSKGLWDKLKMCLFTVMNEGWGEMLTFKLFDPDLFRNMLLTSSWVIGGFLELAAMRRGLKKLLTRMWSCWTYSASESNMLNTTWFLFLMLSAWGERM